MVDLNVIGNALNGLLNPVRPVSRQEQAELIALG